MASTRDNLSIASARQMRIAWDRALGAPVVHGSIRAAGDGEVDLLGP